MQKETLLEFLDEIIKTGTKQAQADRVRQFQSNSYVNEIMFIMLMTIITLYTENLPKICQK